MRFRTYPLVALLAAVLVGAVTPRSIQAQGSIRAQVTVRLTAVVPSVVKSIVDESIRTADGAPLVRVVTNDPAIRRSLALGVPAEVVTREAAEESTSRHSKGGEQVVMAEPDTRVVRYTIVTP